MVGNFATGWLVIMDYGRTDGRTRTWNGQGMTRRQTGSATTGIGRFENQKEG